MGSRTALVTGATGLLGRQVIKAFADSHWDVKGTGFSRADGKLILKVDLGNADEIEKALEDTKYVVPRAPGSEPDSEC
jgi:nucleoside-diphosphate-sugar epimerase